VDSKGLQVNIAKTKIMKSGKSCGKTEALGNGRS